MNIVQQKKLADGCEVSRRFTIYCSNFEFQSIYEVLKLLLIPYPVDSTPADYEDEKHRTALLNELPEAMRKSLRLIIDEFSKAM